MGTLLDEVCLLDLFKPVGSADEGAEGHCSGKVIDHAVP